MASNIKKPPQDKPKYPPDGWVLDGNMDREELLAILDAKYQEELEKKKKQDETAKR